jgi:hypothetical protein
MTRTRAASIVSVGLLALVACSSSTAKSGETKQTGPAADLAVAKAAVLSAADLPGYTETPYKETDDIPQSVKKKFAECMHTDVTIFDDTPGAQKAHSSDFDKDGAQVSGSVEIDPQKSDIDKGWNQLTTPGVDKCLQQLLQAAFTLSAPSGTTVGTASLERFEVAIGDRSVGYTVKIPATTQGTNVVVYADLLYVARDRAGIDLTAINSTQPFDRATEIALAQAMYDRVGTKAS